MLLFGRKFFFAFFTVIFLFAQICHSQEYGSAENGQVEGSDGQRVFSGLTIKEFCFSGLRRTKEFYLQHLFSSFIGQEASEKNLKAVEATLQGENLFDEVKMAYRPLSSTEAAVDVSFKEKIAFLPMPYGYYSDGSFLGGLFIMDMNAFGIHDTAVAGGVYSKKRTMGVGAYTKQARFNGRPGFSVSVFAADSNIGQTNAHNETRLTYKAFSFSAGGRLLLKPTVRTNLSFGMGYDLFLPHDSPWIENINRWSAFAGWNFAHSSWNGTFLSTNSISVSGALCFTDNSGYVFSQSVSVAAKVQIPLASRFRMINGFSAFDGNNMYYPFYCSRTAGGVTILPSNFTTTKIAGLYSGFELCVLKMKIGKLSLYSISYTST